MKITLKEPESGSLIELEAYEMDTPTGIGWSVVFPKGNSVLIKFRNGKWKADAENNISHEFWQTVGNEINLLHKTEHGLKNAVTSYSELNPRHKRARTLKYLLN